MSAPQTARARVRAELTDEIIAAAVDELAEAGPIGLSLRSVARRVGMVPSALYRYFPSRDALLTALIIQAYEEVGAVAEAASTGAAPGREPTPLARWLAVCGAVRAWATRHPHRWALIYGSPVPGYAAPEATVPAALKLIDVVAGLVRQAAPQILPPVLPAAEHLDAVVEPMRQAVMPGLPSGIQVAGLLAWTSLVGMVSLELFGHYKGATTDFDAVFAYAMEVAGRTAGLA